MIIINDLHIGASRVAGTTVSSRVALKQSLLDGFKQLLEANWSKDICILGDLFDTSKVDMADWVEVFKLLNDHASTAGSGNIYLVPGNHDLSKNSGNVSSFSALADLLVDIQPESIRIVSSPRWVNKLGGIYAIPHMVNQEEFDAALKEVPECTYLLVHCNYDNKFAQQSDHSLNLSKEQAEALPVKHIIFAHEHQQKEALGGKVQVIGNQLISSISDCLGNETKRYAEITAEGLKYHTYQQVSDQFCELDWCRLDDAKHQFIRVVGSAKEEEAAEVAQAISKFRDKSDALVISNAVKIGASALTEESLEDALRDVQGFNVVAALRSLIADEKMLAMFDGSVERVAVDQKEF